ncbi:MAG: glycosyl transferase [Patescibacteria group bacterium]|uniref:sugar transferase n=1 Tax=Caldilinea sp. TaxID=2293560 RepID=UPI0021DE3A5C|nr:sugar transferase [Caldilinea sp.]GIV70494.1 MAG: glycosyl transferase [Caldilinea sp.]GIW61001.1 MAG: glycosyl transferase [Patescibacteria group bacterium]
MSSLPSAPSSPNIVDDRLQRFFDIVVAGIGLIVLSPLLLAVSVWVKLDSPGPILYRASRVGRGGKQFKLFKFRSMVVDADRLGPGITTANDARVTRAGRWLRQTKIDELPQLINVLRGDMSLVGPRPEDPRYVVLYTPEQRQILAYRPGITSAASLTFRHEEMLLNGPDWETLYREKIMPAKLAIDLAYMRQRSLYTDLQLILRTIASLTE